MFYRLVSIYYSPEFTRYVLQQRASESEPWRTVPTIDANREFTEAERREFRESHGG